MKAIVYSNIVLDNIIKVQLLYESQVSVEFATVNDCKKAMEILDRHNIWYYICNDHQLDLRDCEQFID